MESVFNRQPFHEKNGILQYTHTDFYWGIAPRAEMEQFNALAQQKGFEQTKKDFSFKGRFDYAENYRRADFHLLLPIKKDATILDLGSGFGNVTIPLAKHHTHVVAADASFPLLEFSSLRAKSEGVENITYIQVDPLEECNLPFKPQSFDAIILNGVLEWVGPNKTELSPTEYQTQFLAYLKTLLKEDGVLYIGIENRLFPGWLDRDPHSKLKYTSILPRFIANWYAKKKGQPHYRTYIYSSFGYRTMLRKAGFDHAAWYYPFPSYREPDYIYSTKRPVRAFLFSGFIKKIYTKKWALFLKTLSYIGADRIFLSSFMIMAAQKREVLEQNPFVFELAQRKSQDVHPTDSFLKVPSATSAQFLVFHEGEQAPFLTLDIDRV